MAEIRDVVGQNPATCTPPSIRHHYTSEASALADGPRIGETYTIGGKQYWYDGTEFLPVGPGEAVIVPETAFADPENPTAAEVDAYIAANVPDYTPSTLIIYPRNGTEQVPDYVWLQDLNGLTTAIETPTDSTPKALIDIHNVRSNFQLETGGYNSHVRTDGRTLTNYEWTVYDENGAVLSAISGAPGVDASGETDVLTGTYDIPTWDTFPICGDVSFCLTVTDSAGEVSDEVCETYVDYGVVTLYFEVDGALPFNASVPHTDGYVTEWDWGDGSAIEESNTVSHLFTPPTGIYSVTARVCLPTLQGIEAPGSGIGGTFQSIFADAPITDYPALESVILSNNNIGGFLPDLSGSESITDFQMRNNNLSGSLGGLLPPNAVTIDISENSLSGNFPRIDNMPALENFHISYNNFSGEPPSPTENPALVFYNIEAQQGLGPDRGFSGAHPDFSNNPDLTHAYMSFNNLSGEVPDMNANTNLIDYRIEQNNLSGVVPDFNMTTLTTFRISVNRFGGDFPNLATPILESITFGFNKGVVEGTDVGYTGNLPDPSTWPTTLLTYNGAGNGFWDNNYPPVANNPVMTFFRTPYDLDGPITDLTGAPNITTLLIINTTGNASYTPGSFLNNASVGGSWRISTVTLNSTDVDNILCDLAAGTGVNVTLDIRQLVPAAPTAVGNACVVTLTGRGWTVQTD